MSVVFFNNRQFKTLGFMASWKTVNEITAECVQTWKYRESYIFTVCYPNGQITSQNSQVGRVGPEWIRFRGQAAVALPPNLCR